MADWRPARRYFVIAPTMRLGSDILRYWHQIEPRAMIMNLVITSRADQLRGARNNTPVFLIDPSHQISDRELYLLKELTDYGRIRDWIDKDFAYLQQMTRMAVP